MINSLHLSGDLIAFFMNDTAVPVYLGISNMGSPEAPAFSNHAGPRQAHGTPQPSFWIKW